MYHLRVGRYPLAEHNNLIISPLDIMILKSQLLDVLVICNSILVPFRNSAAHSQLSSIHERFYKPIYFHYFFSPVEPSLPTSSLPSEGGTLPSGIPEKKRNFSLVSHANISVICLLSLTAVNWFINASCVYNCVKILI